MGKTKKWKSAQGGSVLRFYGKIARLSHYTSIFTSTTYELCTVMYFTNMEIFNPQDMSAGRCYYYPHRQSRVVASFIQLLFSELEINSNSGSSARGCYMLLLTAFLGWSCDIPDVKGAVCLPSLCCASPMFSLGPDYVLVLCPLLMLSLHA